MALVVPFVGGLDVTRAKKLMSAFIRGHGRVPFRPIPRRVVVLVASFWFWFWSGEGCTAEETRIGVVATMRVRGREGGMEWVVGGGILILSNCSKLIFQVKNGLVFDDDFGREWWGDEVKLERTAFT